MTDIGPSSQWRRLALGVGQHTIVFARLAIMLAASMLAISPSVAHASTSPPPPETLSADAVNDLVKEYGEILDALQASGKVTGLSTAIVHGDQVIFERSMGVADIHTGEAVTPDTVFRVASLSKGFASALAGLLVRDGRLRWNTRVADVLTYFRMRSDRATNRMTVRDLLSHQTGLPRNAYDNLLEDGVSYRELVRQLDEVHMTCAVGECYSYQNIAFSMFGDMVYPLTGDFFTHQVAKRIFQPLRMTGASYGRAALEDSASWARPHVRRHGHFVAVTPKPNYYWVSPAAGVNANLRDMERWLLAQMGHAPEVLPRPLLRTLHTGLVDTPWQRRYSPWRRARLRGASYALGWRNYNYLGHTLIYHAGAVEGYRAIIGFLPEYDIGMVAMWNCSCSTPGNLMPMFVDRVLRVPTVDWADLTSTQQHGRH